MTPPRILQTELGQRFGRLTVITAERRKSGQRAALCRCDCGNERTITLSDLFRTDKRRVKSCGCWNRDDLAEHARSPEHRARTGEYQRSPENRARKRDALLTHGLSFHPLYRTWYNMLRRCEDPTLLAYQWYGARGISVCKHWHDIRLFIEDIERDLGPRPDGMSLDRINNNGNYEPGNVQWATDKEQRANRRAIEHDVTCPCGQVFTGTTYNAKYCSKACAQLAENSRQRTHRANTKRPT